MLKTKLMLLLVLVAMAAIPAFADLSPNGTPTQIGSWVMPFVYGSATPFDLISVQMITPGVRFSAGGNDGFGLSPLSGWSQQVYADKTSAAAFGPAAQLLLFNLYFSSNVSDPLAFHFEVYSHNTLLQSANASWTGGGIFTGQWSVAPATAVPESGDGLLRAGWLCGLAAVIAVRRMKLRLS